MNWRSERVGDSYLFNDGAAKFSLSDKAVRVLRGRSGHDFLTRLEELLQRNDNDAKVLGWYDASEIMNISKRSHDILKAIIQNLK